MWWMTALAVAGTPPRVHVDRTAREIWVYDATGSLTHRTAVGVGRGGLGQKTAMGDLITPTGTFTVDLVISETGTHNAIASIHTQRWSGDATYGHFVDAPGGLIRLYETMSSLDFNGDGTPDRAYGTAYVGLSAADAVTGPKMRLYRGTPYWYSIALHGTPDPTSIGQARSGGCVHLPSALLQSLITTGTLAIGQTVVIADGPPRR